MKVLEILSKIIAYGQGSNIELIHRIFSKSPKFFQTIIVYGGGLIAVLTMFLTLDLLPQYNEYIKISLAIISGIVGIATTTKDTPKDI